MPPQWPESLVQHTETVERVKWVLLGAIRKSWEQGAAANALLELEHPELSLFGDNPLAALNSGEVPRHVLQIALSAVYLQGEDGRLSQNVGNGKDGAALDGASAGIAVLLGARTELLRRQFWQNAADKQLKFILADTPRTPSGAISHRAFEVELWSDAIYMGPPFLAFSALLESREDQLQMSVLQCKLYRDALRNEATGTWRHIYSDDLREFRDPGSWATGNAWAALGMILVRRAIELSPFKLGMEQQCRELGDWTREILDGALRSITPKFLVPNYLDSSSSFGDAACSAAFVAAAYRCAAFWPSEFPASVYPGAFENVRDAVIRGVDDLGIMSPVVDPLGIQPSSLGLLSPEAQAFGLMMFAAWRDWANRSV